MKYVNYKHKTISTNQETEVTAFLQTNKERVTIKTKSKDGESITEYTKEQLEQMLELFK